MGWLVPGRRLCPPTRAGSLREQPGLSEGLPRNLPPASPGRPPSRGGAGPAAAGGEAAGAGRRVGIAGAPEWPEQQPSLRASDYREGGREAACPLLGQGLVQRACTSGEGSLTDRASTLLPTKGVCIPKDAGGVGGGEGEWRASFKQTPALWRRDSEPKPLQMVNWVDAFLLPWL